MLAAGRRLGEPAVKRLVREGDQRRGLGEPGGSLNGHAVIGRISWHGIHEVGILSATKAMALVPTGHNDRQVVRRSGRDVPKADLDLGR
jgi:hypothetical protein